MTVSSACHALATSRARSSARSQRWLRSVAKAMRLGKVPSVIFILLGIEFLEPAQSPHYVLFDLEQEHEGHAGNHEQRKVGDGERPRSEEHTSELQSLMR